MQMIKYYISMVKARDEVYARAYKSLKTNYITFSIKTDGQYSGNQYNIKLQYCNDNNIDMTNNSCKYPAIN